MKKLLSLVLAVVMVLSLVACGTKPAVVAAPSDLLDNRDALRRDELVKVIIPGS